MDRLLRHQGVEPGDEAEQPVCIDGPTTEVSQLSVGADSEDPSSKDEEEWLLFLFGLST
jgi:hypothetical protein